MEYDHRIEALATNGSNHSLVNRETAGTENARSGPAVGDPLLAASR
jgi:hypothetical protein